MNVFQAILFTDFLVSVGDMDIYHCLNVTVFYILNILVFSDILALFIFLAWE